MNIKGVVVNIMPNISKYIMENDIMLKPIKATGVISYLFTFGYGFKIFTLHETTS
jgi:hypothetical protein